MQLQRKPQERRAVNPSSAEWRDTTQKKTESHDVLVKPTHSTCSQCSKEGEKKGTLCHSVLGQADSSTGTRMASAEKQGVGEGKANSSQIGGRGSHYSSYPCVIA